MVFCLLGPKWRGAAAVVRLRSPTVAILASINPLGWLIYSLGLVARSLRIALVFAPIMITGYVIGLPYGPKGVAFGYSTVMILWANPHILWCVHGGAISFRDIFAGGEPTTGLRHLGWSARLWSATDLRPIRSPFAAACSGKQRSSHHVLRGSSVRRGIEVTVSGSSWGFEGALIGGREALSTGLEPV